MSHCNTRRNRQMTAYHGVCRCDTSMPSVYYRVPLGTYVVPGGTKAEYTRTSLNVCRGRTDHDHDRFPYSDEYPGDHVPCTFADELHRVRCVRLRVAHAHPSKS